VLHDKEIEETLDFIKIGNREEGGKQIVTA
jgi:hypothetical protein